MNTKYVQELMDREAIRDCMYRYCRGIDRADEKALRQSYWPEARELHGIYNGSSEGFINFALEVFKTKPRNIHLVSNILIEFFSQTVAAVESYFTALQRGPDRQGTIRQYLIVGRYCDRFEKRSDEWRVIERVVAYDWLEEQQPSTETEEMRFGPRLPVGKAYPDDPVYKLLAGEKLV
jgi:hypothetical protein